MGPENPPRRSGCGRILLFTTLALVALIGSCGYLAWTGMKQLAPAQAAADKFMATLSANDVEGAYALTDDAFRGAVSKEQFQMLLKNLPLLTSQAQRTLMGLRVYYTPSGTIANVQYTLAAPPNSMLLLLVMRQIDGRWLVEAIQSPGLAPGDTRTQKGRGYRNRAAPEIGAGLTHG